MNQDDRIVVEHDVPGCDGDWDCKAIQHIDGCYGIPWDDVCNILVPGTQIDHVIRCTRPANHGGAHQGPFGKNYEGSKMKPAPRCQETLHGTQCTLDAGHLDYCMIPGGIRFIGVNVYEGNKMEPLLRPCQEKLHGDDCVFLEGHSRPHQTPGGIKFLTVAADRLNPEAAKKRVEKIRSDLQERAQHDVTLERHVHKITRQRTEIRRLNTSLARLSALSLGRLERNQRLQRENNRLAAHLTTATQERDAYKRMLEEANDRLAGDGYFLGLSEE